jgi:hypothetical protein
MGDIKIASDFVRVVRLQASYVLANLSNIVLIVLLTIGPIKIVIQTAPS